MNVQEAKKRREQELFEYPNVLGVCTGKKVAGGRETGEDAIVVLVQKKGGLKSPGDAVPREISGHKTDVLEAPLEWCIKRPVMVGDSIGRSDKGQRGTLGLVYVDPDNRIMMLTAAHVVMSNPDDDPIGESVSEPAGMSQVMPDGRDTYQIGTVAAAVSPFAGTSVDAAAIDTVCYDSFFGPTQLQAQEAFLWRILTSTVDSSFRNRADTYFRPIGYAKATPGDTVVLIGATTGRSVGTVYTTDLSIQTRLWGKPVRMTGLHAYTAKEPIIAGGDSGGIGCILNSMSNTLRVCGTLSMGAGKLAVAVPIARQLRALHPAMREWTIGGVKPGEDA